MTEEKKQFLWVCQAGHQVLSAKNLERQVVSPCLECERDYVWSFGLTPKKEETEGES
jgi:hypothetical protein